MDFYRSTSIIDVLEEKSHRLEQVFLVSKVRIP